MVLFRLTARAPEWGLAVRFEGGMTMGRHITAVRILAQDTRGVTAMEYGMIAAATIVAIAGFMLSISGSISTIFSTISTSI